MAWKGSRLLLFQWLLLGLVLALTPKLALALALEAAFVLALVWALVLALLVLLPLVPVFPENSEATPSIATNRPA